MKNLVKTVTPSYSQEISAQKEIPDHIHKMDIGNFAGKKLNDIEKLNVLENVWKPDENFIFKSDRSTKRRFNYAWLLKFQWLAYSKLFNGAFCVNCTLFSSTFENQQLCQVPFTDWKNAISKFEKHGSTSPQHKRSLADACEFQRNMKDQSTSIVSQLDSLYHKNVALNRQIIKSLIRILATMAWQCIPLRGRNESDPAVIIREETVITENPGNFLAIVRLAVELDCPILKQHLSTCGRNATYLSKTIQNELLSIISDDIIDQLTTEIKTARYFSVLGDEAVDISNKEQMPIIIRYVNTDGIIKEVFVRMAECLYGCSGYGLAQTVLSVVEHLNLDMNSCRGQGYDGAGNLILKY